MKKYIFAPHCMAMKKKVFAKPNVTYEKYINERKQINEME